jgi:hypothetical protein
MNFGGGRLVGVPTTAGTFSFTVTASAACACLSDRPTKTFTLQVGPAGAPALVSSANPSVSGQPVSLTLTAPSGATVNFFDGSRLLGTKTSAYGKALLRGVKLSPGSHAISATFTPKLSSDWPVPGFVQQVDPAPTATTLIAKPITQVHARMVTLTAHVKRLAPATGPVAAGTVSLYDNETLLVTLPVANGSVTFKTNALATGTHPMTAVFNGSSDEQSSSTGSVSVVIV